MSEERTTDEFGEPLPRRGRRGRWIALAALVLLGGIAAAVWAFWPRTTSAEVIAVYRDRFAELRGKLKRIAANLPPVGSVRGDTLPASLDPKPVYDVARDTFNTAVLMAEQCENPDRDLGPPTHVDVLLFESGFRTHLQWTGDKNPLIGGGRDVPARDMAQKFERSLALPYLVVARPVRYDPPVAVNENTFAGGELDLEVFLVDVRTETVLGAFRRTVRPDPQVLVTFRKDQRQGEVAEAVVYSNLMQKVRTEVCAALARGTGGTFNTERSRN